MKANYVAFPEGHPLCVSPESIGFSRIKTNIFPMFFRLKMAIGKYFNSRYYRRTKQQQETWLHEICRRMFRDVDASQITVGRIEASKITAIPRFQSNSDQVLKLDSKENRNRIQPD